MSKKGFTLTEILGVIVIIGILLILIIPGIISRISNSGDEASETENQLIYDATDQYIRENPSDYPPGKSGRYCITIQSLVDDGKLVAPVKDVTTGKDITDMSVMVTIYSTGNTDHELREGAECKELAALPMIDFKVEPSGSSWVKQRKVTIIYPTIEGNFKASHRIDNGSWTSDSSANNGGNIELVFTKIGKLEARLTGDNVISSKINIINVDSQVPVITKVAMGSWSGGKNNVQITAKDDISGLNGLYISTSNSKPSEDASGWISISSSAGETKTFTRTLDLGTYYIWVKDKAGNISSSNTSLKVADTTKPTCSIADTGTKGSNNWYTGNATLKLSTSDKESGVASYGMNTSNSATYNGTTQMTLTYDTKSQTYYGFVKDRAGNVGTCSKTVKRDTTKPSCSLTSGGTVGNNSWYRGNITVSFKSRSDSTSTVTSYGMGTSSAANYNSRTSLIQTADTKGITYYGYVKDGAGNTNTCSLWVKKDATQPTISSISKSGTWGSWTNQAVSFTAKATDATSGMNSLYYRFSSNGANNSSWNSGSNASSATKTFNTNTNSTIYVAAVDNAGNQRTQEVGTVRLDVSPPYVQLGNFYGSKLTLTGNSCQSYSNRGVNNAVCDIYFTTARYCNYSFEVDVNGVDEGGSGIAYVEQTWTHDGTAAQYPNWTRDTSSWDWRAVIAGKRNTVSYINWGVRYIDNAGNVGPSLTMRIHLAYDRERC